MAINLTGGQIAATSTTLPDLLNYRRQGKIRILGIAGNQPSPFLPQLKTFAQQGMPDLVFNAGWYGVFARGDTPAAIKQRISAQVQAAVKTSAFAKALEDAAFVAVGSTAEEAVRLVRGDYVRWGELVKALDFTPE